ENWSQHDNGGRRLDEHADEEESRVDAEQEHEWRSEIRAQKLADLIGHTGPGDQVAEQAGVGDDEQDNRRRDDGLPQNQPQILQSNFSINDHANEERIENSSNGGYSRREHA